MKTGKPELPDGEVAEPNEPTTRELLAMLIDMRRGDQKIATESLRQTRQKSNTRSPEISACNPRGEKDYPTQPLAFEVLMPWQVPKGSSANNGLDREEIELMNRIKTGDYWLNLLDGGRSQCCIIGTKNQNSGKLERIALMGARDEDSRQYATLYNKERRGSMPTIKDTLHQILRQQKCDYSDIMTMEEEMERIALPADDPRYLPVSVGE